MGKKVWMSDDGMPFDTKAEMDAYENAGPHAEIVGAYLETIDVGDGSERAEMAKLTRIRNILNDFLAWQDEQDELAVAEESEDGLGNVAPESVAA